MTSETHAAAAGLYPPPVTPGAGSDAKADRRLELLGWLVLTILALAVHVWQAQALPPAGQGVFTDNDSLVRAYRVLELHSPQGSWFDPTLTRIDPPRGGEQHWTRIVDAPYYLGGLLGQALAGDFRLGLEWAGLILPPLMHVLFLGAVLWLGRPFLPVEARIMAAFLTLMHFSTVGSFLPGRIDYHNAELLSAALMLGFAARLASRHVSTLTGWLAGLTVAVALWIGVEMVLIAIVVVAAPALRWLLVSRDAATAARDLARSMLLFLLLCALAERGPYFLERTDDFDKLCLLHVLAFTGPWILWEAVCLGQRFGWKPNLAMRAAAGLAGAALSVYILGLLLPQIWRGSLFPAHAAGSPAYMIIRGSNIAENESVLKLASSDGASLGESLGWLVLNAMALLIGLIPLAYMLWRRPPMRPLLLVCAGCLLTLLFHYTRFKSIQVPLRATYYIQLAMAIPAACVFAAVALKLQQVMNSPQRRGLSLAIVGLLVLLGIMGTISLAVGLIDKGGPASNTVAAVPYEKAPVPDTARADDGFCDARATAEEAARLLPGTGIIAAHPDQGPYLLYYTDAAIIAFPNHRQQPALDAFYKAMHEQDPAAAHRILSEYNIRAMILCGHRAAWRLFPIDKPGSTAARLAAGEPLPWAEQLGAVGLSRIFRIQP